MAQLKDTIVYGELRVLEDAIFLGDIYIDDTELIALYTLLGLV